MGRRIKLLIGISLISTFFMVGCSSDSKVDNDKEANISSESAKGLELTFEKFLQSGERILDKEKGRYLYLDSDNLLNIYYEDKEVAYAVTGIADKNYKIFDASIDGDNIIYRHGVYDTGKGLESVYTDATLGYKSGVSYGVMGEDNIFTEKSSFISDRDPQISFSNIGYYEVQPYDISDDVLVLAYDGKLDKSKTQIVFYKIDGSGFDLAKIDDTVSDISIDENYLAIEILKGDNYETYLLNIGGINRPEDIKKESVLKFENLKDATIKSNKLYGLRYDEVSKIGEVIEYDIDSKKEKVILDNRHKDFDGEESVNLVSEVILASDKHIIINNAMIDIPSYIYNIEDNTIVESDEHGSIQKVFDGELLTWSDNETYKVKILD